MRKFVTGRVFPDTKRPIAHIKLEDIDLEIGEYICYSPTAPEEAQDTKLIIVEPSSLFKQKMERLFNRIKDRRVDEARSRDEMERKRIASECVKLEAEYRTQMSSSFTFINKGYDVIDMEVPKNCLVMLDLKGDSITALSYDTTSLILINPDDAWRYDSNGDRLGKRDFIQIFKNAI